MCRVKDITLLNSVLWDVDGRIVYAPNSFILTNMLVNYTDSGFTALTIPIWIGSSSDFEKVKAIVLDEADIHPCILPEVRGEERSALMKSLERSRIRSILGSRPNLLALNPHVNVVEIQGTRMKVVIKVWIREVHRREEITGEFLMDLNKRFREEGIALVDV